jgi:hypothetical protein
LPTVREGVEASDRAHPFPWRLVDASFGVVGIIPLWITLRDVRALERG